MSIPEGYTNNFNTLLSAVRDNNVCIMECKDIATDKMIIVICAVQPAENGEIEMVPFAKMFDGNPYDEVKPPE